MNFLGHLFLSGDDPLVTVGNFMGDAVKGRDLSRFHPSIERGIRLHRTIDDLTDNHPLQQLGRARVRAHAGRYAGVVMDLFFDHLLAERWSLWHPEPLDQFNRRMYALLSAHAELLPDRTRNMLPYMEHQDWLSTYARLDGIGRALQGLARRVPAGGSMVGAERVLAEHLDIYREEFAEFLPWIQDQLRDRI